MKIKGRLIVLTKPGKIKFAKIEMDASRLKSDEIAAKTLYSAISSGTETAAYSGKPALRPGKAYPRLVGYCNAAVALNVGAKVKKFRPGDLILSGESHRSLFKIKETDIFAKIPKQLDPGKAALAYLYNLGLSSLLPAKDKKNPSIAVIGLGVIGLGVVEQAAISGYETYALSDSRNKLKLAKKLGAEKVFLKNKIGKIEKLADIVVLTSDSWVDWRLALRLAKPYGAISVIGFPGRNSGAPDFNPLEPKYFYDKKIAIIPIGWDYGVENSGKINKKNCGKILELMKRRKLHPENLISGIFSYEKIESAYEKLLARDGKSITYLLKWPA